MVFGGYLLKAQCLEPWDGRQYERLCYNDLQPLYSLRGVEQGTFPYVHGALSGSQLVGGAIEYPVLTGVFMWASGKFVLNSNEYLRTSAILLGPFALIAAYLLAVLVGWRALLWSAAPAIVLYSFHNWDLLVVAAAAAGFYMWHKGRIGWAGVWFGVGAAFKMYPIFFLVPLALERWFRDDRRGAVVGAGGGLATFALINLPFIVKNPAGWWATYEFHQLRTADFNSIWHWLEIGGWSATQWSPPTLNLVTSALLGLSFAAALGVGWLRARRDGSYPFVQVCAAMLAAFLLWNKVHSPQYALWIMPFFALVAVSPVWWAAYSLADLALYVGIFRWFFDLDFRATDAGFAKQLLLGGLWARAALLLVLMAVFLRARPGPGLGGEAGATAGEGVSHPRSRFAPAGERAPA